MRMRQLLFCSTVSLFAACSDGGEDIPTPEGPKTSYVISKASLPTTTPEATEFGLDLNGDKAVDNQLGNVLAALVSQGFDVKAAIDGAVDEGDIVLLMQVQTTDFTSAKAAGLSVLLGDSATVQPAPCSSITDTVCRKHLDGNGSFAIASNSPTNAAVAGKIVGGTFNSVGSGNIAIQIALGGTQAIRLDLIGARAKATGISEAKIDSVIVGGAISEDDLNGQVLPAIHSQLAPLIAEDCTGTVPPDCGCAAGSTGKTLLNLFDSAPKDCSVSVDEIKNHQLIKSLLAPDVNIDGKAALSLGLKVSATKATIR